MLGKEEVLTVLFFVSGMKKNMTKDWIAHQMENMM